MSLQDVKSSIQNSLDGITSPRLAIDTKVEALRKLERLLVQAYLKTEKGKDASDDTSPELHYFLALQATFECNIISHLLPLISISSTRLQQLVADGVDLSSLDMDPNEDHCAKLRSFSTSSDYTPDRIPPKEEARLLCKALTLSTSLIQGLVLNHDASKEWIGRKSGLETMVDLLLVSRYLVPPSEEEDTATRNPSTSSSLTGLVLDTLLCILVPTPSSGEGSEPDDNSLRNFEDVQGLQAVVKILKWKGSGRAVRMKCLEFLYFYLLDETSPKFTGLSSDSQIPPIPRSLSPTKPLVVDKSKSTPSNSNSTSTPSYQISRSLHARSQSQIDSSLSNPSPAAHNRSGSGVGLGLPADYKPHSRNTKKPPKPFLPSLPVTTPNTPSARPRAPTPVSRYGSSSYAFSAGSSGGTFSTSSIPNSRTSSGSGFTQHSRAGSMARTPSTRSNSPEKSHSRGSASPDKALRSTSGLKEAGSTSAPSSRSVSSSSAASASSAFSVGSETSTAASSVYGRGDDQDETEREDAAPRKSHSRNGSASKTPAKSRAVGGGIGLGRPGSGLGSAELPGRTRTPQTTQQPEPKPYIDFVPATPAPKKTRRTADGPSTPVPKLGLAANSNFARTPAPMKKGGSEGVIGGGPSSSSRHLRTKSGLGRASSLGDIETGQDVDVMGADEEKEKRKEDEFWDFQAVSPQKKTVFFEPQEQERKSSSNASRRTRTTKEKTAILGTMLGNVDALVRSLEGVRLG